MNFQSIERFIYATPFTIEGRAHGELHEQYKRKTILTAATHFPYVKTRIQVLDRHQVYFFYDMNSFIFKMFDLKRIVYELK
jgi:hypothetical protein